MNIENFIKESKVIQSKLNGVTDYNPKVTNLEFVDKIGYNKANKDYFKAVMQKDGIYLSIAPTNAGKTYLVNDCFEDLKEDNDKLIKWIEEQAKELNTNSAKLVNKFKEDTLYLICCPNKLQNEQNEVLYGFKALVAGKNAGFKDIKVSAVYEKVDELIELKESYKEINKGKELRIVSIIDESHTIVNSADYRQSAVTKLKALMEISNTTICLTATPDNMKFFKFDEIINFVDKNYKAPTEKIVITKTNDVKEYVKQVTYQLEKPFIRINSKDIAETIADELREELGKKVITVNADTKQYDIVKITDTYNNIEEVKKYDLIAYNTINEEKNPLIVNFKVKDFKSIQLKEGKYIITTNVKVYKNAVYDGVIRQEVLPNDNYDVIFTTGVLDAGTNMKVYNKETIPVFAVLNAKHLNLDDMEQFPNRLRNGFKEYKVVVGNEVSKYKFLTMEQLLDFEIKKVNVIVKSFENRIKTTIEMYEDLKGINGEDYKVEDIKADIEHQLNFITANGTKNHMNCITVNDDLEIVVDKMMIWKNVYDKYNRQLFYNTDLLAKELKSRFNVEVIVEEVEVEEVKKPSLTKEDKEELAKAIKEDIKTLAKDNEDTLKDFFNSKINVKELKDSDKDEEVELGVTLGRIEKHTTYTSMRNMLKVGIDYDKALDMIMNKESKDINNYIKEHQTISNNNDYLKGKSLAGEFGIVQEIILNKLYTTDKKGYMKVKRVSKELLQELVDDINTTLKGKYTIGKVKKLIKVIFKVKEDKKGLILTSLSK